MNNIIIRKATKEDMPAVHGLVKELAEYENALDCVDTTAEIFARDAFGSTPLFECLVAENEDQKIVGSAIFYWAYSTWRGKTIYLDDLIITASQRRKGMGRLFFDKLVEISLEENVYQLRWHVLDWNEPAINFYKKLNTHQDPTWNTCWMDRKMLEEWGQN